MKHKIREEHEPSKRLFYPRLRKLNDVIYLMLDPGYGVRVAWTPEAILYGKASRYFSSREIQLLEDFYGSITLKNDN